MSCKGRSVARCLEPVNVIYCYITILIQPEALISLLDVIRIESNGVTGYAVIMKKSFIHFIFMYSIIKLCL